MYQFKKKALLIDSLENENKVLNEKIININKQKDDNENINSIKYNKLIEDHTKSIIEYTD